MLCHTMTSQRGAQAAEVTNCSQLHTHTHIQGNRGLPTHGKEDIFKHWQACWSINPCISKHHSTRHFITPGTMVNKRKIKIIKIKTIYQGENNVYPLSFIRTNLGIFHSLVPSFTGKAGNTHSLGFLSLCHSLLIMHHLLHPPLPLPLHLHPLLLLQRKSKYIHKLWILNIYHGSQDWDKFNEIRITSKN